MIIFVGSQKGGCGKSTIAVNICAALVQKNKDVMLVDADRQSTASNWIIDRLENKKLPLIHCIQKYENVRDTLLDLGKRYEYVIVDSAGRDSRELRTGMTTADILLIPFRPSQPDLDTVKNLQEIITQAKDLNPTMSVYGLITMAPTNHVINESIQARTYLKNYPEIKLLNSVINDRKVYRDAMSEGMGVVEMNNQKACDEINDLVQEIFQW